MRFLRALLADLAQAVADACAAYVARVDARYASALDRGEDE